MKNKKLKEIEKGVFWGAIVGLIMSAIILYILAKNGTKPTITTSLTITIAGGIIGGIIKTKMINGEKKNGQKQ